MSNTMSLEMKLTTMELENASGGFSDVNDIETEYKDTCPVCGSTDVTVKHFHHAKKPTLGFTEITCHSCGQVSSVCYGYHSGGRTGSW